LTFPQSQTARHIAKLWSLQSWRDPALAITVSIPNRLPIIGTAICAPVSVKARRPQPHERL
jgi:hypothetical protein